MVEFTRFLVGGVSVLISYYKTSGGLMHKKDHCEPGAWVNCTLPSKEEIKIISREFKIDLDFLNSALDEEESSRIDIEDGTVLIVIDIPLAVKSDKTVAYYTTPLSIFLTEQNVITITLKNSDIINSFAAGRVKRGDTSDKTNFILNIILYSASRYLRYLNQIIKSSDRIERSLRKSMKNKELIQLLEIEKSLVYFSSSLKTTKVTLEKLFRAKFLNPDESDKDLMDDVLIEIGQAIEMTDTYLNIISGTMEAFASIISNNLNIVMKILASLTLIISIPTVVSGIYGMNTPNLPMIDQWWFPIILSLILIVIALYILRRKDMI